MGLFLVQSPILERVTSVKQQHALFLFYHPVINEMPKDSSCFVFLAPRSLYLISYIIKLQEEILIVLQ